MVHVLIRCSERGQAVVLRASPCFPISCFVSLENLCLLISVCNTPPFSFCEAHCVTSGYEMRRTNKVWFDCWIPDCPLLLSFPQPSFYLFSCLEKSQPLSEIVFLAHTCMTVLPDMTEWPTSNMPSTGTIKYIYQLPWADGLLLLAALSLALQQKTDWVKNAA